MLFLWTKNDLLGSKIIRWGLEDASSHFAVCFFEHHGNSSPVIESRMETGVSLCWFSDFLKRNQIVHALRFPFEEHSQQARLFHSTSKKLQGRKYDKRGILFWAWVGFQWKFFGTPIPTRNQWADLEQVYCVEVIQAMRDFIEEVGIDLDGIDLQMVSPDQAFQLLSEDQILEDVTHWFV